MRHELHDKFFQKLNSYFLHYLLCLLNMIYSLSFWGIAVSGSQAKLGNEPPFEIIDIPGYVLLHARLAKQISVFSVYVKAENLLDEAYFAEPGFPMKARTFMLGFGMNLK
ncbi:MAG: hypothetical protein PVH61_15620 [Candidatus Aminicenantes bacterium]